jgi:ubiquitin carboxyl-terminal hydrolase 36/42
MNNSKEDKINFDIKKGFTNLGNTCFYNATLQSIFKCEKLINALKDYKPKSSSNLLKYLQITIEDYYLKPEVSEIGPSLLLRSYRQINQDYMIGSQDCARECLTYFLDNFSEASKIENINIDELFDCNLTSVVKCLKCNNISESSANEKVIVLPIENTTSYEEAMNKFLSEEKLTENNLYDCEKCKERVPAIKKLIIKKTPEYLFIALKRFEHEYIKQFNKMKTSKINTNITVPNITSINNIGYELKGCIYHMGSINGGHYVYYHKFNNSDKIQWVEFNDSNVRDINNINDIINKGYIYLYCRSKIDASVPLASSY